MMIGDEFQGRDRFEALAEFYFRPRRAEIRGRIYRLLGVLWFKRHLMRLVTVDPGRRRESAYVLAGRTPCDLAAFEKRTRRSELIHLNGLALSVAMLFLAVRLGSVALVLAAIVVALANFHCFILQRFNRARIVRILDRRKRRTTGQSRRNRSV